MTERKRESERRRGRRKRTEKSHILNECDWESPDRNKTKAERESNRGTMGRCIGDGLFLLLPSLCFRVSLPVSLILSLSLFVHIETSLLEETRERGREILVVCLSPPHHGAPETKERTHTHTLFQLPQRRTAWLCVTLKTPLSPQSDRQVDSWVLR